jgi:methyl acetate hydrolase
MALFRQTRRKLLQSAAAGSAAFSLAKFGVTPSWSAANEIPGWVWMVADDTGIRVSESGGSSPTAIDSVFWIASMTKPVTAVAAMQLVGAGKFQLDTPVYDILRDRGWPATAMQVLEGFDGSGKPILRPANRAITVAMLLTHTSGFTYTFWNANTDKYMKYAKLPNITSCKNAALETPLAFDPGAPNRWEYGISMDWLGKVIERVSGQNLRDYMRTHIFQPLGMHDTDFIVGPDQRRRLATMRVRGPDGKLKPIEFELPQQPEFFMGGGGLYSTAGDYMTFLQMLMHGGKFKGAFILPERTVTQMLTNKIGDINLSRVVLKTAAPDSTPDLDMGKLFPGQDIKWGLGFLINPQEARTGQSGGSVSWAGLANTYFWLDPVKRMAGVYLTQLLPFLDSSVLDDYSAKESSAYSSRR